MPPVWHSRGFSRPALLYRHERDGCDETMSKLPYRGMDQISLMKRVDRLENAIVRWADEGGGCGGVVSRGDVHLQNIAAGVRRQRDAAKRFVKRAKKLLREG